MVKGAVFDAGEGAFLMVAKWWLEAFACKGIY